MGTNLLSRLVEQNNGKIVLFVMDGLGGVPLEPGGLTALEAAKTPNLDSLATDGICGLHQPVRPGVTPGSGPSHLALFGYDPVQYQVGRGVLSALGIDFELGSHDVAARGNFCTVDKEGIVQDRRAGRIPTELNRRLSRRLQEIEIEDLELYVETVKEYRLLLVLRGQGLSGAVGDTDPQETGVHPHEPVALERDAERTAGLVKRFVSKVREELAGRDFANLVLLRGFSKLPQWPSFRERFGLSALAIAAYPMYRGVAKLVGMEALQVDGGLEAEIDALAEHWDAYDFYFVHFKPIDSAGEDGDWARKIALIEEADRTIPRLRDLNPDVLIVTGDHSTPSALRYHSWHPVPTVLWSPHCRSDLVAKFGERTCMSGGLGPRFPASDLMPLALGNAKRLSKFGA
jgi:2,3-bisphosphoglycerate-independent phosphoglycerate mutase